MENNKECTSREMENQWKAREQARIDNGTYESIKLRGDDLDRFLHVSLVDPCKVAYTKNGAKGQADIQTRTSLEKYCRKFGLESMSETRIKELRKAKAAYQARDRTEPLLKSWAQANPNDADELYKLECLENALVIIAGEYPINDERYTWARKTAKEFGLDLGEMG